MTQNGNLTSKVEDGYSWTYEWNAENQLKRVLKDSAEVARFAYDPKARRVEKVTNGILSAYTYAREDVVRQSDAGTVAYFVHGPGIDEPLASERPLEGTTYYHADALGSIVTESGITGAASIQRRYSESGQLQSGEGLAGYAFTGREWDPETRLYHYRARYYDPGTARFLGPDPAGFLGGMNLFAYVENSPTDLTDPFGWAPQSGSKPGAKPSPKPTPTPTPKPKPTPDPSIPFNVGAYVCCISSKMDVCPGPSYPADASIRFCVDKHENRHIEDFSSGRFPCDLYKCGAARDGLPVMNYMSNEVECSGYCAELECLVGQFQSRAVTNRSDDVQLSINANCGSQGCPRR